jgi:membrane protein
MRIILRSFLDFFRDGGPMLASSIMGFFLMSFFPFCLLILSSFGYLLGEDKEFYTFFYGRLSDFFPGATREITGVLRSVIDYREIGIFTALLYFYFSYQLFMTLESAVNRVFEIQRRRPLIISILLAMLFITSVIILMTLSFAATSVISVLDVLQKYISIPTWIDEMTGLIIGYVAPMIVIYIVVSTLYLILPNARVPLRHALAGGLFTSILLEIAKNLFTLYMTTQATRYGAIYGPLTAIVIFLLWVLYAASIFLIGAEVVYNLGLSKKGKV